MSDEGTLQLAYRPETLDEVVGNEHIVQPLSKLLEREKEEAPRAYFFHGPFGCGKTTFARIICNELEIDDTDTKFLNMSNYTGVEHMRDLLSKIRFKPLKSAFRVYIMDEFHRCTKNAQDCFLNDLEKPPPHVIFIVCTTEPENVLNTIRSRCHQFAVKRLKPSVMKKLLDRVVKEHDIEISEKVIKEIALQSEGTPRDALVLLDMVSDIESEKEALRVVSEHYIKEEREAIDLCRKFIKGELNWKEASQIIKSLDSNVDFEFIRRSMLNYTEKVLLDNNTNSNCFALFDVLQEKTFMYTKRKGLTWVFYYLLNEV